MPYALPRQSVTVSIPATQSIRIGNPRGVPIQMLTVQPGRTSAPVLDVPTGNTTYGPYPVATDLVINNNGYDTIEYVIGATPGLTDVVYNPGAVAITGGTINGTSIGASVRASGLFIAVSSTATDSTGTPGNVTNNSANGRAAFAAAGTAVVVTNSSVAAADSVHVTLLGVADATVTRITGVAVAAGSFTVTGDVAATAAKSFMFTVIKA